MISMDGVPRPQATPETPDAEMDTGEDIYAGSAAAANCAGGEVSRHSRRATLLGDAQQRLAPRGDLDAWRAPPSRRLARKAESARQARLRHKQFVQELQEQARAAPCGCTPSAPPRGPLTGSARRGGGAFSRPSRPMLSVLRVLRRSRR